MPAGLGFVAVVGWLLVIWRLLRARSNAAVCRIMGVGTLFCFGSFFISCIVGAISFYFACISLRNKKERNIQDRSRTLLTGTLCATLGMVFAYVWGAFFDFILKST